MIDFEKLWKKLKKIAEVVRLIEGWKSEISRIEQDEEQMIFLTLIKIKDKRKSDYFT